MADHSAHAELERQCDRLTAENAELLQALGEARRELVAVRQELLATLTEARRDLATYKGYWQEECRRTVNAVERQIAAERELGAARPVLEALKAWLRATNHYDAWGPRDRLRKLGYAWMRSQPQ